jgi:hypothetical protein
MPASLTAAQRSPSSPLAADRLECPVPVLHVAVAPGGSHGIITAAESTGPASLLFVSLRPLRVVGRETARDPQVRTAPRYLAAELLEHTAYRAATRYALAEGRVKAATTREKKPGSAVSPSGGRVASVGVERVYYGATSSFFTRDGDEYDAYQTTLDDKVVVIDGREHALRGDGKWAEWIDDELLLVRTELGLEVVGQAGSLGPWRDARHLWVAAGRPRSRSEEALWRRLCPGETPARWLAVAPGEGIELVNLDSDRSRNFPAATGVVRMAACSGGLLLVLREVGGITLHHFSCPERLLAAVALPVVPDAVAIGVRAENERLIAAILWAKGNEAHVTEVDLEVSDTPRPGADPIERDAAGDTVSREIGAPIDADFGGFHLTSVVDAGGAGVIYRADSGEAHGALKVFYPEQLGARPFRGATFAWGFMRADGGSPPLELPFTARELERTADELAALKIPHTVPTIAIGETGGTPWVLSAWVNTPSLRAVLENGSVLDRERLLVFGAHLAEALDRLHAAGHFHGAVHAGHVHVDPTSGAALLADVAGGFLRRRSQEELLVWAERTMMLPALERPDVGAPSPPLPTGAPRMAPVPRIPEDPYATTSAATDVRAFVHLLAHAAIGKRAEALLASAIAASSGDRGRSAYCAALVVASPPWLAPWLRVRLTGTKGHDATAMSALTALSRS